MHHFSPFLWPRLPRELFSNRPRLCFGHPQEVGPFKRYPMVNPFSMGILPEKQLDVQFIEIKS